MVLGSVMEIIKTSSFTGNIEDKDRLSDYLGNVEHDINSLMLMSQSRIRFGDGADGNKGENMSGIWQLFTSDATPDTEFAVTHGVGATPIGRLIMYQDKAGSLYQGPATGTSWNSTTAYFKCDVASVTFLVFFIK